MSREALLRAYLDARAREYELCTRSLNQFVVGAWDVLEPQTPLLWNWHHDLIREVLVAIGEDPDREGLKDTPKRVVKSWSELYAGYMQKPAEIPSTVFEDGACDEVVILKNIAFSSMCEHHMIPFIGVAHIAYLPFGIS